MRLCTIFQAAKEPIVLRDKCTVCTNIAQAPRPEQQHPLFGQQDARHLSLGRYYESADLQQLPMVAGMSRRYGDEDIAVLEPESFDPMFRLRDVLPSLEELEQQTEKRLEQRQVVAEKMEQQSGQYEPEMSVPTFTMELTDRTKPK